MLVREQYRIWIDCIATRKRNPVKRATLATYQSCCTKWILPEFGSQDLSTIENSALKHLVTRLTGSELSPATISLIINCVKNIVSSAVDENGNETYPRHWNTEFIDAPILTPKDQNTPIITSTEVREALIAAPSQYGSLLALLAGSGARISEALALKMGPSLNSSYWDPNQNTLVILKALWRGQEQTTKTVAGVREIDLAPNLGTYLINRLADRAPDSFLFVDEKERPLAVHVARYVAETLKIPGFHSFRRFRITHLENMGVPQGLIRYWAGHADRDVHDRYVKLGNDIQIRKEWAKRAGLGFELPKITSQTLSGL